MSNRNSAEYQRAVGEMVGREVKANVSALVDPIVSHVWSGDVEGFGPFERDDLYSALCPTLADLTEDQIDELAAEQLPDALATTILELDFEVPWADLTLDEKIEVLEWLRIEPEQREVMEWWSVSGWLASELGERGEIIIDNEYWGRQATGQAIALDNVICNIYDALHKPRD